MMGEACSGRGLAWWVVEPNGAGDGSLPGISLVLDVSLIPADPAAAVLGRQVGFAWAGGSFFRLRRFVPVDVVGTPVAPAAGGRVVGAPRSWKASRADG